MNKFSLQEFLNFAGIDCENICSEIQKISKKKNKQKKNKQKKTCKHEHFYLKERRARTRKQESKKSM